MQVNHGKLALLKRIHAEGRVAFYSPSIVMRKTDGLPAFTAIGEVCENELYHAAMQDGKFLPYRRDVSWRNAEEVPTRPLLDHL